VSDTKKTVGLIGLGLVGTALARRLLGAGFAVAGYDVEEAKRARLVELGGRAASSVTELARECKRIVVAVFNTDQVEDVVEGGHGVLAAMASAPGPRIVLNVTTSDPERVAALAARVAPRALTLLEVPMSGTSEQIARGDGVGLIGGEREACDAAADILDAICPKRYFVGAAGNGGKTKLAVNLILGLNRAALAEGLVFAERLGLDPRAFLEVARGSAAYSQIMDVKGDKMVNGDFAAHGKVTQSLKDVHLMLDYAKRAQQVLPLTLVSASLLNGCVDHGEGDWDNCAVIREIRRLRQ
jgi:3-hydroxyisobutyrate dehydrogenase-like beta-hydroxyacid dehydrogenase